MDGKDFIQVKWQEGPVLENGVNGAQVEDVIGLAINRLEEFQNGKFPCIENAEALQALRFALKKLNDRTERRRAQGVEGKNLPHRTGDVIFNPGRPVD